MMLRRAASTWSVVLAVALLAPVPAATSAPPGSVDPTPVILAAGAACPFATSAVASGKEGFNVVPNNPQFFAIGPAPGLRITVTNLSDPEKVVTINATGAFHYVDRPDGSTEIRASGHNFIFGEPGIGATALATTGPVTLVISPDGDFVGMDVSQARVRDLCAELA